MTSTLTAALAEVCGYHEGDSCQHCAEVLRHRRARGWTDAEILADIELYRTDFAAWEAKVRARAADHRARLAEVHPVSRALFDEDPAAYEPHGHHDRPAGETEASRNPAHVPFCDGTCRKDPLANCPEQPVASETEPA